MILIDEDRSNFDPTHHDILATLLVAATRLVAATDTSFPTPPVLINPYLKMGALETDRVSFEIKNYIEPDPLDLEQSYKGNRELYRLEVSILISGPLKANRLS